MSQKKQSSNYTVPEDNNGYSEEELTHYAEKKEQLLEQHKIEDTPFTIIKYGDKWFLTMGKYRLTEPSKDRETIEAQINDVSWNRIMQVIMATIEEQIKPLKEQNEILTQLLKELRTK